MSFLTQLDYDTAAAIRRSFTPRVMFVYRCTQRQKLWCKQTTLRPFDNCLLYIFDGHDGVANYKIAGGRKSDIRNEDKYGIYNVVLFFIDIGDGKKNQADLHKFKRK